MNTHDSARPDPHALLASLLAVMTRHAETGCPDLALLVQRELDVLARDYPEQPLLAETALRLLRRWRLIGAAAAPAGGTRRH